MYKLCAQVDITGERSWSLNFVTAVEITRDTEKLTAEATITLPKKIKVERSLRNSGAPWRPRAHFFGL
jgi:hypothetical protein